MCLEGEVGLFGIFLSKNTELHRQKLLTNWENKFILAHNAQKTYIETSTARCHSGMTNGCHVLAAIPEWLNSMSARTEKVNCLNRLQLAQQSRSDAKYSCLDRFRWKRFSAGRHFKSKPLASSAELFCSSFQSWILKAFLSHPGWGRLCRHVEPSGVAP